jgi:hypothetical protein
MSTGSHDNPDDDFTDTHPKGASHHEWFSTNFVDDVDCRDGCSDIDDTDDSGCKEGDRAACETEGLENDRCVVNDYQMLVGDESGSR